MIALTAFLITSSIGLLTNLEFPLGLDTLFEIRGPEKPPEQVVIITMDEASESRLAVGQDLTRWRGFHAGLIRRLQQQGAALIVFDLQFIRPHPGEDQTLAEAMRAAGNVLVVECVQKFRHGDRDFYGREECSDNHSRPPISRDGDPELQLAEQLVAMRIVPPLPAIADAILDRAPFYLINDAQNASVREVWTFYDALAETPSLPVLAWFYYAQQTGNLPISRQPLSPWLVEQRRACPDLSPPINGQSTQAKRIRDLLCRGDSRYLNYYGPSRTLRMESYSDVYDGKVGNLQGKVVFVGRANRQFSPGKSDFFQTPYSDSASGKMAGVEIMATQFANALEDRFLRMPIPHWLASGLFGWLIAWLLIRWPGRSGTAVGAACALTYAGTAYWLFATQRIWLPVATPLLLQVPLSWLLAAAYWRYDLLSERSKLLNFVQRVFPQWLGMLPAAIGQSQKADPLAADGIEIDINGLCLATDIEGYTAIAAQHTPRQMRHLLNTYYQVLGHPVISHGGIIADVTGDAMMAVWLKSAEHRRAACLAALEMEAAVAAFNQASNLAPLPTRIGLHEGELTLGSLDTGNSSHYRAIGDTVNTASRIQGVNKLLGTRILASQSIVAGLADIKTRSLGAFRVMGRSEPVELAEILGDLGKIDAPPSGLRQSFDNGLAAFRRGHWLEASLHFQLALAIAPRDGPTRFYLDKARSYNQDPPHHWDGALQLDIK